MKGSRVYRPRRMTEVSSKSCPPILVDAAEKPQGILGNLESVTIRYEKVLLVFFRVKRLVVILSYDPKVTTPFVSAVSDFIRMLGTNYLGE
jgi:hypothetical protein